MQTKGIMLMTAGKKCQIVVFNTAADSSGAMAELNRFRIETEKYRDKEIGWHYVLGRSVLPESPTVRVHRYPWTKRGWGLRVFFDIFIARQIVRSVNADYIISLQNNTISCGHKPQLLFVQLCFPFVNYKFPLSQLRLWIHQNIIGYFTIRSVRKADLVIVQNEWMREACTKKAGVDKNKIKILRQAFVPPLVLPRFKPESNSFRTFFFPATGMPYKNHLLLIEAAIFAKQQLKQDFNLILTIHGNELDKTSHLKKMADMSGLNVAFIGALSREDVFKTYSRSVLIFPSLIETVGLPLVEAKATGCVILAYDAEYSRDVLKDYSDAYYFSCALSLSNLIGDCVLGKIGYHGGKDTYIREGETWTDILEGFIKGTREGEI